MAEILCEVMAQRDRMRDALEAIHASVVALPPFAVAMGIESICRHALRDAP